MMSNFLYIDKKKEILIFRNKRIIIKILDWPIRLPYLTRILNKQTTQNITKKVAETSKIDRDQQLKAADVGSNGATESVAKKKYRRKKGHRQELTKLIITKIEN